MIGSIPSTLEGGRAGEFALRSTLILCFALAIGAPMLFGGAFPWSVGVIAWVAWLTYATAIVAARGQSESIPTAPIVWASLIALLFTGLQACPLPFEWVSAMAPRAAEEAARTADALGRERPSWVALSRDPGSTLDEMVKGAAIVSAFGAGWLIAAMGRGRAVLNAVGISSAAMALVGLGHVVLALDAVWGVYQPIETSTHVLAPLINGNQLAGFMALGAPLLIGIAQGSRSSRIAWSSWAGATLCILVASMTLSRGGIAVAWGGSAVMIGVALLRRRRGRSRGDGESPLRREAPALIAGALLALVASLALEPFLRELESNDLSKLELSLRALSEVWEAPLVGLGRGGFGVAFVEQLGTDFRYSHPENIVAQWVTEWGVVVGPFLLLLVVLTLARALIRLREAPLLGATIGLFAIGAQNLVDFGLEMVGICVVAALLFGVVAFESESRRESSGAGRFDAGRLGIVAAPLLLLLLALLTPGIVERDLRHEIEELHRLGVAGDREGFEEALEVALRLHPSAPSLALVAAAEGASVNDPSTPRWLNRAMQRAPGWPSTHRVAAVWLLRRGASGQAALEIREAETLLEASTGELVCELVGGPDGVDLVMMAAPREAGAQSLLIRAARCADMTALTLSALDARALERERPPAEVFSRAITRALDGQRLDEAAALLARARPLYPELHDLHRAELRLLGALGDERGQLARLEELLSGTSDPGPLLREKARILAGRGDADGMLEAIAELRGMAGGRGTDLAELALLEGDLRATMGQTSHALRAYGQSFDFSPSAIPLRKMARIAESAGQRGRAIVLYRRICALEPGDARACERSRELPSKRFE